MNTSVVASRPTGLPLVPNKKPSNQRLLFGLVAMLTAAGCCAPLPAQAQPDPAAASRPRTFCNPLDLDYRFMIDGPSRREAADPTLVRFKDEYWLFASKSGGYWHSSDLTHWKLIEPTGLPLEDYAPAVEVINGQFYYTAFNTRALFTTEDPLGGVWTRAASLAGYPDPDLFKDDDGRVFLYFGCSENGPIQVVELDPRNQFRVIGRPQACFPSDYARHGFEVAGQFNRGVTNRNGSVRQAPWTEGAWMTKHAGVYYLQYSAPGTEFVTYADGVYTATNPLGPFTYAPYSPFSHKPTGFIGGAGHSSTMQDAAGRYWHVVSMSISVRHSFERRLGLFPLDFTKEGQMFCNTYLGDYPQYVPGAAKEPARNNSPGWMLLSYAKSATASSTLKGFPVSNAFDEDIRTWWSAATGDASEWLQVDLGKTCRVEAMQVNFADQGATNRGRLRDDAYRYYVEASDDGRTWKTCLDRKENRRDAPHDYAQLDAPVTTRYLRLKNVHSPAGGLFSVSGWRVFGSGLGQAPSPVQNVKARRDNSDGRVMNVSWSPQADTDFYIVRYGIAPDRLFNNYQIRGTNSCEINSLNVGVPCHVTVDAVNDNGVTQGSRTVGVE